MASSASPSADVWSKDRLLHWTSTTLKAPVKWLYGYAAPLVPTPIKTRLKHVRELAYWRSHYRQHGNSRAETDRYYQELMLNVAGETSTDFVRNKRVVDFGCGPLGSLSWAHMAAARIGVDVLAGEYLKLGVADHGMTYVTSSEALIPLPSQCADIVFTVNSLDHVSHFEVMCEEVRRLLAPGGELIASLNLGEPPTLAEPQTLSEARVTEHLLAGLEPVSYRVAPRGAAPAVYRHFFDGTPAPTAGPRYLWLRARKSRLE